MSARPDFDVLDFVNAVRGVLDLEPIPHFAPTRTLKFYCAVCKRDLPARSRPLRCSDCVGKQPTRRRNPSFEAYRGGNRVEAERS